MSSDSEKELAMPSLQSTERRWAMARTDTLGRENRAAEAAGGMAPASKCKVMVTRRLVTFDDYLQAMRGRTTLPPRKKRRTPADLSS
ncbi:hypothetical protein B296_00036181 [Ensete ventricosum]|uniref:Uncharacterized protein n=1 Tax=Ensete ventricosum TaxID=4639 RepID=A0A426XBC5_ENSVE|nr:hypothetical protein B296_00036181 [Ensete ventricosum]